MQAVREVVNVRGQLLDPARELRQVRGVRAAAVHGEGVAPQRVDHHQHDPVRREPQALEELDADELMRRYLETLEEQDERHDGGGKWVGTGGRSPFGHGGEHPTGIRVGGESKNRSAMKVAEDRRFQDYRTDMNLDLRNTKLALKRLRHLTRAGQKDELDIDETIDGLPGIVGV